MPRVQLQLLLLPPALPGGDVRGPGGPPGGGGGAAGVWRGQLDQHLQPVLHLVTLGQGGLNLG